MATRSSRSLTSAFTLLNRRFTPSCAHVLPRPDCDGDDGDRRLHPSLPSSPSPLLTHAVRTSFSHRPLPGSAAGFASLVGGRRGLGLSLPLGLDASLRYYSSGSGGSNEVEYMKDMAEVLTEKGVDVATGAAAQVVPVVSEVAVAAADSAIPVAALQHLIDAVHNFTGLNWWAAIALTTLLIRTVTVPLLINGMKAATKLSLMRPHLEEIKQQMENSTDPQVVQESHKRMKELFRE